MMTDIFIAILTLGTLVHYGKSHVFSASFVALEAKQEQIIFVKEGNKWMHFAQSTFIISQRLFALVVRVVNDKTCIKKERVDCLADRYLVLSFKF